LVYTQLTVAEIKSDKLYHKTPMVRTLNILIKIAALLKEPKIIKKLRKCLKRLLITYDFLKKILKWL